MSTRNRHQPWFRPTMTIADIEHAAQFHYGWEDWNEPLRVALRDAQERFLLASFPTNCLFVFPFSTTISSRYSSLR